MYSLSVLTLVVLFTATGQCDDNARMLPYERTSIDDCRTRFFRIFDEQREGKTKNIIKTILEEFAHVAAIGWTGPNSTRYLCTGSLIWENFILTAAHCAADENNVPPDVARMGDFDIYLDDDDDFVQELKITDIIRHPEHRYGSSYYDIALMKLERYVIVFGRTTPACLWLEDEIRFPKLLAAGWGITGTGYYQPYAVKKAELTPIMKDKCSTYNVGDDGKLPNGLMDHQLCAINEKIDGCPEDYVGPLYVKLLRTEAVVPFLVGVMSFGKVCDVSEPGVYVKVSSFGDWIIETLQRHDKRATRTKFMPWVCASQYLEFRELLEDIRNAQGLSGKTIVERIRISTQSSDNIWYFKWPNSTETIHGMCVGTLIEPNVVLTLAECVSHNGNHPTQVRQESNVINIAEIVVHPLYNATFNPYSNNIAVVKLKSLASMHPFCGWYGTSNPGKMILVTGTQRTEESEHMPKTLRVLERSPEQCPLAKHYAQTLADGLLDEHVCYENQPPLVPGLCDSLPGSPIERNDGLYVLIDGIHLFGRDCGYGEPAVGVRLSAHKAWLESVLLPQSQANEAFLYIDPDLDVADECRYADGTKGECTAQQNCPAVHARVQNNQQLVFCKSTAIVCCPGKATSPESIAIENEFNECEERYRHLRTDRQQDTSHIVEIGWQEAENATYDCYGYLISTRGVVSSASCLLGKAVLPNIVRLGGLGESDNSETILIEKVVIHPRYNATTQRHNIAIVKLGTAAKPSEQVFPGCVWQNFTHSPIMQKVFVPAYTGFENIHPMYKSDCETLLERSFIEPETSCMSLGYKHYYRQRVFDAQLRYEASSGSTRCFDAGSPIVWRQSTKNSGYIEFLVHIYSHGSCDNNTPRTAIRITMYVEWFKEVLQ